MLYDCFRVTVMVASVIGIIHMFAMGEFTYIYYPIVAIIWGSFSFFDENDREHIRRNGYDYDYDYSNPTYYDNSRYTPRSDYNTSYGSTRYTPYTSYKSRQYDGIVKKCKRNFNITIAKDGEL